jgi:hypothetical protein
MRSHLRLLPAMLTVLGCGTENPGTGTQLPADVARVFQAQCASCHSTPPQYGAPMPLTTWADTQRSATSDASRRVWQLVGQRVHDATRPMPPTRLNANDLAVIDRWVGQGAPGCEGASCGAVNAAPTTSSPTLSCAETHRFVAHAPGSTGPFRVQGAAGNLNKCFAFRSPFNGTTQAVGFAAAVDSARVLHHMILFATDRPQRDGAVFDCDGNMPRDARFVTGWAPGNQGSVLPADVGLLLPAPTPGSSSRCTTGSTTPAPADDASGISMCTTDTPRRHVRRGAHAGQPRHRDPAALDLTPRCRAVHARASPSPCTSSAPRRTCTAWALAAHGDPPRRRRRARRMLLDVPSYSFDSQVTSPSTWW